MPRKPKPPPAPTRRRRNTGSISVQPDLSILARVPSSIDKRRPSREFPPGHIQDAEAWLDAIVHPRPVETVAPVVTLGEWIPTWWDAYVRSVRPSTTARRYRHSLRLLAPLGATLLPELRQTMLQTLVGELSRRLGASTLGDAVGVWRRCLEAAMDDGLIPRNPAKRLVVPQAAPQTGQRHLTAVEVAALWPAIEGKRFEPAYALLLACGLRIGEVLGLHWSNVHLAEGRAWIQHQWTDHRMRDLPKGRNPHGIALPPRVVAILARHRAAHPDDILVMQSPHPAQRRNGKPAPRDPRPWSYETVRTDLIDIVEAADIAHLTSHAARRGLVSALLDGGVSPAVVAERVGHASAATTLKHYAQPNVEARRQADAVIDAYLGPATDGPAGTVSD